MAVFAKLLARLLGDVQLDSLYPLAIGERYARKPRTGEFVEAYDAEPMPPAKAVAGKAPKVKVADS